jgi:hypothetical protein
MLSHDKLKIEDTVDFGLSALGWQFKHLQL